MNQPLPKPAPPANGAASTAVYSGASSPSSSTIQPGVDQGGLGSNDTTLPPPSALKSSASQMPPRTLSALSSVASTQIPKHGLPGVAEAVNGDADSGVSANSSSSSTYDPGVSQAPTPGFAASRPPTTAAPTGVPLGSPTIGAPVSSDGAGTPGSSGTTPVGSPPLSSSPAASPPSSPPTNSPSPSSPPAGPASAGNGPGQPQFAATPKPWKKYLPFIAGGGVLLVLLIFVVTRLFGGGSSQSISDGQPGDGSTPGARTTVPGEQKTLEYWGLWEPSEVMEDVIAEFEANNLGVKINYTKQSHRDYRERLQTAIASGAGPDLFRFHASWTPMMSSDLAPIPASVMSAAEFRTAYYPVADRQLQINGQHVGIPLMYDGLALLYNKDMLTTAGVQPPQTWSELRTAANTLTLRSGNSITRGGLAIGNATNVEHFSDILAVLMLQNGADPGQPNSPETRDALLFYTNFVKSNAVWSDALPASSVAFARGEAAMIFAPSWRIHEIQAMNPEAKIGVVPLPKLADERIAWASYWAEGMNARGQNKELAAAFLKFLSSPETLRKLYSSQSQVRAFGELYPRVDMADEIADNELISAYLEDAPYASGWHLSSLTHDNGLNDQIIKYYADAVSAIVGGARAEEVLGTLGQGTTQVLRQYGAASTTVAPPPGGSL
jgi:ABC-type glycerol-3-phosphate transport system substrate-binding protein